MTGVVAVDLSTIERSGPNGAAWSLPHGGDLDANLVMLAAGAAVASHTNREVDVLVVVVAGAGTLVADGDGYALAAEVVVHVPKGAAREIRAGAEPLVYLTVHRSRRGLTIGRC